MIEFNEYSIILASTKEMIEVFEIKQDQIIGLESNTLDFCTKIPREILEEAKLGYTRNFESLLKTQPIGCLVKIEPKICRLHKICSIYNPELCNLKYKKILECFEFGKTSDTFTINNNESLATQIVHAWKSGKYVILTD